MRNTHFFAPEGDSGLENRAYPPQTLAEKAQPESGALRPVLTKSEAADLLRVSTRTIDRWYRSGLLPADTKSAIGGTVRFRTERLLQFVDNLSIAKEVAK